MVVDISERSPNGVRCEQIQMPEVPLSSRMPTMFEKLGL